MEKKGRYRADYCKSRFLEILCKKTNEGGNHQPRGKELSGSKDNVFTAGEYSLTMWGKEK
jgi:hypothetical protein